MKKTLYLEGTVHQSLIQVYDHADLSLVLGFHGRQEVKFMLLTGQNKQTSQPRVPALHVHLNVTHS